MLEGLPAPGEFQVQGVRERVRTNQSSPCFLYQAHTGPASSCVNSPRDTVTVLSCEGEHQDG